MNQVKFSECKRINFIKTKNKTRKPADSQHAQADSISYVIFSDSINLGCYHKILQTGQLIYNRNLFLTDTKAGCPNQGASTLRVLFRTPQLVPSHCVHRWWKRLGFHWSLLYEALISLMRLVLPSWHKTLPQFLLTNTITLGFNVSTYAFGGNANSQMITLKN